MTSPSPSAPPLQLLLAAQAPLVARAQQAVPGWLTADEEARLAGMQHAARRQEFMACRWALRHLLAMGNRTPASGWRLDAPEGRAPQLNAQHHGAAAAAATHLSLSHSGAWLACAVAPHSVGIDLEVKDIQSPGRRDVLALAAMACSPGEQAQLQALDGPARQRHFLQIWSLKEAYFKCTGTGVDFSAIRRIECRPAGPVDPAQVLLAHARSWHGATADGHAVLLSVCVLPGAAQAMPPCALHQPGADIAWQDEGAWHLVAWPG